MEYLAHSENDEGETQTLEDHLHNVAKLAKQFAGKWNAPNWGFVVGLLHDAGKFSDRYQEYVRGDAMKGGDHSSTGALYSFDRANILALPIRGHHGGLENKSQLASSLRSKESEDAHKLAIERTRENLSGLSELESLRLPQYLNGGPEEERRRGLEFFLRMVFSALVDADFMDTEKHFDEKRSALRGNYPELPELWNRFKRNQQQLIEEAVDSELNRVRTEVYRQCMNSSDSPQGVFSLTVPTGGGKTRSGMGFALNHAVKHDLDRVIVVIPYTSIIEQTVDTYRGIFSDDLAVLEHHSGIRPSDYSDQHTSWWELASENWDAPIVVTTTVQFFESLYANKPSKCRKLHNISNSVVIVDEVQTLPEDKLEPVLDGLTELTENYNTTVVLSTATQPAFSSSGGRLRDEISDYMPEVKEIVDDPKGLFRKLKRVRYQYGNSGHKQEGESWADIATRMSENDQAMAVTNTRDDARSLFEELTRYAPREDVLHLSSNLCGAHRREVLSKVKRRLDNGERCLLATTQVVEAGVDIDFPVVFRAIGPLDRIVQAAGRCNREGNLKEGQVVIFKPKDGGIPPGSYKTGTDTAKAMLSNSPPGFLHDPGTYFEYFSRLYQAVDIDAKGIQQMREGLRYSDVSENFELIDQDTEAVAIPWDKIGEDLLERIERTRKERIGRNVQRELQPYLVNLYQNEFNDALTEGVIEEIVPDLYRWEGRYDEKLGLILGNSRIPIT